MAIGLMYRPLVELASELGVAVEPILARFELTREQLFAVETRLSPDQGRALGRAVLAALPADFDRCEFGLRAAERFAVHDADLLGYIVSHCEHPLAVVRALAEHGRLIGDSADFRVEESATQVIVTLSLAGGKAMLLESSDFAAAIIYRVIRDRSRGRARPCEVLLPRPRPRRPRLYERYFGTRVRFDAPAGVLVYERSCMLERFGDGDERLMQLLSEHAAQRVRAYPRDDWQDRVRVTVLDGLLRGDYALEQVALRCGVGERTLRRRLAEAGTSYRELVDDVRKERALALLESELSVTQVAQQLGFSDATAFARAFRRWTGSRPHEHRRARRAVSADS